jgi:CubicO group peptidase (beta-lactamase class C family)
MTSGMDYTENDNPFGIHSAIARDHAKSGRLYLHDGNWNGRQILSQSWVEQSTKVDITEGSAWNYQYQWWLISRESDEYMSIGHLGQYLYVNPEKQVIFVRLGKNEGDLDRDGCKTVLTFLAAEVI